MVRVTSARSEPTIQPLMPVTILRAANLTRRGFPHGFSTRAGGVSEAPFASLNFGAGDEPGRVTENVRRFAGAVGFAPDELRQVTQVHGARVAIANFMESASSRQEADAVALKVHPSSYASPARAVGVRVADCVPILVGGSLGVIAIHAGWKGVVAGVIDAAFSTLTMSDSYAAIGPCIGPCCFEVGVDVAETIAAAVQDRGVIARTENGKAYVDLRLAVRLQLATRGAQDIEDVPGCTKCDAERFFSYRRDGERSGRHLAAIALAR
jgi:YfiH family protein